MSLILPPNEIIKPATLSRRGFLRAMGVTATVIAVPSLVVPEPRYVIGGKSCYVWILKTVKDGLWSDPETWGGILPTPEDSVIIAHKLTIDRNTTIGNSECPI